LTVGIDDYHTPEEIDPRKLDPTSTPQGDDPAAHVDLQFLQDLNLEGEPELFDRVVSKLEIYAIKDPSIFEEGIMVNGVRASITHPDKITNPNEKWIDLKGDKFIYLKITYDDISKCRRPITDLNFYKISRFKQKPDKMMIHVK